MNKFTQILAVFTILVVLYQTVSSAPAAARMETGDLLQRHKRHAKRTMTVEFNDGEEADAERIEDIEAAVSKLSRSRRSTALFLQAALRICSQIPRMCATVRSSSSDGANLEIRIRDR